jgi:malate dehydrogenase (oxaloacetate-decarboxylating)(NADP+)
MGIPVGKLSLYTACAGVDPSWCLPNHAGRRHGQRDVPRRSALTSACSSGGSRGEPYDALIEEFMDGAAQAFPNAIVQFEDFGKHQRVPGARDSTRIGPPASTTTSRAPRAVTLAALWSALRGTIPCEPLGSRNLLFLGAGEAGTGIGELVVAALMRDGMGEADARARCWFVDAKGLVVRSRSDSRRLQPSLRARPRRCPTCCRRSARCARRRSSAVSGQPRMFTREAIRGHERDQRAAADLRAVEPDVEGGVHRRRRRTNGAAAAPCSPAAARLPRSRTRAGRSCRRRPNNAYIFPGIGLGAIACGARRITSEMFLAAAATLANSAGEEVPGGAAASSRRSIAFAGISVSIAGAVAKVAHERKPRHRAAAAGPAGGHRTADVRADRTSRQPAQK